MMVTTTLYKYFQSELIKEGLDEFVQPDETGYFDPPIDFVWFDEEFQFTTKLMKYDDDIQKMTNKLFSGLSLKNEEHDKHFKKIFVNRFIERQINRQTIEAFKMVLVSTFLSQEDFINSVYENMENFITQTNLSNQKNDQSNKQKTDGKTIVNNRSAFADLPQSSTNLDVNNTVMEHATDNTISKNKQENNQQVDGTTSGTTDGKTQSFQFDELIKSSEIMNKVFEEFDRKCFLQIW